MKRILLVCLFIGIGVFQVYAQKAQNLTWDIQLQKGREGATIPRSQIITAENGQNISFFISPESDCFCYIISQNSERKIFILHDQPVKSEMEIKVEPLKADNSPGAKTLYVIMSLERQTKLEDAIKSYKSDPGSQRFANNLQGEIAKLQDTASGLGEPASALITSGGTTRGPEEFLTRFSEKNLYVRTLTIRTTNP
jgi:hypothetical protein